MEEGELTDWRACWLVALQLSGSRAECLLRKGHWQAACASIAEVGRLVKRAADCKRVRGAFCLSLEEKERRWLAADVVEQSE